MLKQKNIIKEIKKVEETILGVKGELKTLRNKVRAYKDCTRKHRKKQKELEKQAVGLKKDRKIISQERDEAVLKLAEINAKIAEYQEICARANQITDSSNIALIQEAARIFAI